VEAATNLTTIHLVLVVLLVARLQGLRLFLQLLVAMHLTQIPRLVE
jgi:hypothetical protein